MYSTLTSSLHGANQPARRQPSAGVATPPVRHIIRTSYKNERLSSDATDTGHHQYPRGMYVERNSYA